tara:strand:+ start:358 stop:753 length:396 start_codon:yes stop_codon:yes gene_type:complete
MYNTITSVGYLVKDPEVKQLSGGKTVARLRVGISPSNAKTKCFIDLEVWDKTAEIASKYLTKGREFVFSGQLAMDTWEKDGKQNSRYYIKGRDIQFLNSGKKEDSADGTSDNPSNPPSQNSSSSSDDEIPF